MLLCKKEKFDLLIVLLHSSLSELANRDAKSSFFRGRVRMIKLNFSFSSTEPFSSNYFAFSPLSWFLLLHKVYESLKSLMSLIDCKFLLFLSYFVFCLQDCHIKTHSSTGEPVPDTSQDYVLLSSNENATHITLRFRRKLDTCDEKFDVPITVRESITHAVILSEIIQKSRCSRDFFGATRAAPQRQRKRH